MMIWKNQSKMKSMNNGEEEEEEKETTLERTSSNPLLILSVGKVFPPPIFETVVCLHFQGQEKNLLTYKKGNKKVPE